MAAALVGALVLLSSCGRCGDRLLPDGKHSPCAMGCIVKDANNKDRHQSKDCSCTKNCPCWVPPPVEP
jgi:hypothetical protein